MVVMFYLGAGAASAKGPPHAELYAAYYDYEVLSYCGLVDRKSDTGFKRRVADLLKTQSISEQRHVQTRIHAWIDGEKEWLNRGLGGFRNWCRTDGMEARQRLYQFALP